MLYPGPIKVGAFDIAVVPWRGAEAYGEFRSTRLEIAIGDDLSGQRLAETLLHELMHAIWHVWALSKTNGQEVVVRAMALGMATVMRDNPELMPWIQSQLRGS
mgnify:CR=1 FL=1